MLRVGLPTERRLLTGQGVIVEALAAFKEIFVKRILLVKSIDLIDILLPRLSPCDGFCRGLVLRRMVDGYLRVWCLAARVFVHFARN